MDFQRFGREREEALTSQRSIAALQEIKKSHPHAIHPLQYGFTFTETTMYNKYEYENVYTRKNANVNTKSGIQ